MPTTDDKLLDNTANDGKKAVLITKDIDCPEVDVELQQQFIEMIAPFGLKNPKGVYVLAHHINNGVLVDDRKMAQSEQPKECELEMMSLMEMLLSITGWDDVECVRVGYVLKSDGKTMSISLKDKKFYEKLTKSMLKIYLTKYAPHSLVKDYLEKKYNWQNIMKLEVDRLREKKSSVSKRLGHRPSSNLKIYCLLLLFFDILGIEANKENSTRMISILQLMGLWKEEQQVDNDSYGLVIRQWHSARKYKFLLLNADFPDKDVFEGINGLTFC